MNNEQFTELQQALATVRRCTESLQIGRRYKVSNLCSRIMQEARKTKPEAPQVSARYAVMPSPAEPPSEADARSQRAAILRLLEDGRILSKSNAKQLTGAEDYRKRISELRRLGHPIADRWVDSVSRYGHPCRYKEYYLKTN